MRPSGNVTAVTETTNTNEINALVDRAKAGDVSAFEGLYRRHINQVYSLCYRMTVNKSISEELTQEAFVRIWQKLELFSGTSSFSTWMHRLVTNVVISQMRKKNLIDPSDDFEALLNQSADRASSTSVGMDLQSAILKLPNGARQIFVLHDVEGYKHSEISTMLDIAEGTSKTQLHRSRKLLREWMQ
jgi:RNA polymerase sigma-70 factor (ECF subfamily)